VCRAPICSNRSSPRSCEPPDGSGDRIEPLDDWARLVRELDRRRETVLADWRIRVQGDPKLADSSTLTRMQFQDRIPWVLDALSRRLRSVDRGGDAAGPATREARHAAAEHGGQRWQQGCDHRQTVREWRHLQPTLLDVLEAVTGRHAPSSRALDDARRAIAVVCMDGAEESVNRYAEMKQAEAASRIASLDRAIAQLGEIETKRLAAPHRRRSQRNPAKASD